MLVSTQIQDNRLNIRLSGELDHHAARQAMEEIAEAIDCHLPLDCCIDMSAISFMDSSGIAVILNAKKRMAEIDGRFWLENVPAQALKVLTVSGVYRIVEMIKTAEAS